MSASEMREAAAKLAQQMADSGHPFIGLDYHDAILSLPLPDEEGMVERVADALRDARLTRPSIASRCVRMTDEAIAACVEDDLRDDARAALRAINGGAEGGEARQHIQALLGLHIAHHNNPVHGAARAFLSKMEAK